MSIRLKFTTAVGLITLAAAVLAISGVRIRPGLILERPLVTSREAADRPDYVPGQILVKFRPQTQVVARAYALAALESRAIARLSRLDIYVVAIPRDESVEKMVAVYEGNPDVEFAEPNYLCRIDATPNDNLFQYQYALSNTGQQIGSVAGSPRGKASADIKAPTGWEESKGSPDVLIAVIDTGVDLVHPDLKNKVQGSGRDFVNNDFDAGDDNGHGSMVAGIAAAETNNGEGVAGVSWNSKILPLKAMNKDGVGPTDKVAEAIRFAADNGARIINLSLGSDEPSNTLRDACKYAFDKGVFIAASAGNGGAAVHYPAAYDNYVFAVAATDYNDARASFSAIGAEVDAAAPGVRILAPYPLSLTSPDYLPYAYGDGTSFAAPHVAGLAALIKSLKPSLSPTEIMNIIRYSADDVNADQFKGKDEFLGYGRINIEKAIIPLKIEK